MKNVTTMELFGLKETIASGLLEKAEYPWEVLSDLHDYIISLGKTLPKDIYEEHGENIWIAKNADVASTACLSGPLIIDEEAQIRHCAYIRGSVIVGKQAVVGNSTELKNCILFNKVQVPHYNYVGDSILGYQAHMGAGAITSNVKSDKAPVVIKGKDWVCVTGLKKVGAMLGDNVEIGCNSVLNPGTVIGKNSSVYPTSCVRGVVPQNSIFKSQDNIVKKY